MANIPNSDLVGDMHGKVHQELFEAINEITNNEYNEYTHSSELQAEAMKAQMEFGRSTMFDEGTPTASRLKTQTKISDKRHEKKMLEFNSDFEDILGAKVASNSSQPKPREPEYTEIGLHNSLRKSDSR